VVGELAAEVIGIVPMLNVATALVALAGIVVRTPRDASRRR
jgi:hypothetical protein